VATAPISDGATDLHAGDADATSSAFCDLIFAAQNLTVRHGHSDRASPQSAPLNVNSGSAGLFRGWIERRKAGAIGATDKHRHAARSTVRRRVKLGAGILAHDCILIDMSDSGVRLHVAGFNVPDEFVLLLSCDGVVRSGAVATSLAPSLSVSSVWLRLAELAPLGNMKFMESQPMSPVGPY
jgi:hypothetical protein